MATEVISTIGTSQTHGTIAIWEAATQADLVDADEIQIGEMHGSGAWTLESSGVTIAGSTTDATRYRLLRVVLADRHNGTELSGLYMDDTWSGHVFTVSEDFFQADYLAIRDVIGFSSEGFRVNNNGFKLGWSMIYDFTDDAAQDGVHCQGQTDVDAYVHDSFFFNISRSAILLQINLASCEWFVYNCTGVLTCANTANANRPTFGFDNGNASTTSKMFVKNCYADNNMPGETTEQDYFGASTSGGIADLYHCACHDDSPTTAQNVTTDGNEIEDMTTADQIVSFTANFDLHLKAGNGLEENGLDLTGDSDLPSWAAVSQLDIDGNSRPAGQWDIGAHQRSTAPAGGQAFPSRVKAMAHLLNR